MNQDQMLALPVPLWLELVQYLNENLHIPRDVRNLLNNLESLPVSEMQDHRNLPLSLAQAIVDYLHKKRIHCEVDHLIQRMRSLPAIQSSSPVSKTD